MNVGKRLLHILLRPPPLPLSPLTAWTIAPRCRAARGRVPEFGLMAQEGDTQGELVARAKRAAARAAAEEEAQYEEEAAAGDISGTESVNDEEDAGVAAAPLEVRQKRSPSMRG